MMPSNASFARRRMRANVAQRGRNAVAVHWSEISGGIADPLTGALRDGVETSVSGTLNALAREAPPQSGERRFVEIEAGDVILDLDPEPQVVLAPGQLISGTRTLEELQDKGARFEYPRGSRRWFTQQKLGENLASSWDVVIEGQRMLKTILLRKAT